MKTFLQSSVPANDHQQVQLLWAATQWPGLLDEERKNRIIERIRELQLEDGGWSIRSFGAPETLGGGAKALKLKGEPDTANPTGDGYQTGLAVVVLRDAGVPAGDPAIRKAIAWLKSNQRESGRWWTRSLNIDSRFHYISFSGTAYAALALAKCDAL